MTPLLRFDGVTLVRGGRILFEDLNLEIGPGDALQVVGANGSGKSSLLRLAAALLRPQRGRVERAQVALADDAIALDRELVLARALSFWGGDAEHGLETFGLAHLRTVPVRLLSTGQAKRASLARVAASGSKLWLLDEPANGLDSASVELLSKAISRHRASGGAIAAASHTALAGEWRTLELGR